MIDAFILIGSIAPAIIVAFALFVLWDAGRVLIECDPKTHSRADDDQDHGDGK